MWHAVHIHTMLGLTADKLLVSIECSYRKTDYQKIVSYLQNALLRVRFNLCRGMGLLRVEWSTAETNYGCRYAKTSGTTMMLKLFVDN